LNAAKESVTVNFKSIIEQLIIFHIKFLNESQILPSKLESWFKRILMAEEAIIHIMFDKIADNLDKLQNTI